MITPIPLTPKYIILYVFITILGVSLLCLNDDQGGLSSLNSLHEHLTSPQNPFLSKFTSSSRCPQSCKPDPFIRHGLLNFPSPERYNETRWIPLPSPFIPFTDERGSSRVERKMRGSGLSKVDYSGHIPPELEDEAAEQITAKLNLQEVLVDEGEWDWLNGRMVLFLDDRNNVEQLCGQIHGVSKSWGGHVGGFCHVERIDLTIVWWFLYGLVDTEDLDEWRKLEARPLTFENRIKDVFIPAMKSAKIHRTPDLVVVSSLFWDEGFIRDYPQLYPPTSPLPSNHRDRPGFLLGQVQWHQSRLSQLFTYLKEDIYDEKDLPIMFRTRHIRSNMKYGGGLKIRQLDQGARQVCESMGIRAFGWGDLLEGVSDYYDNDQHFPLGPNTYLFGDMTFFYLRKAITPGCWACSD